MFFKKSLKEINDLHHKSCLLYKTEFNFIVEQGVLVCSNVLKAARAGRQNTDRQASFQWCYRRGLQ